VGRVSPIKPISAMLKSIARVRGSRFVYKDMHFNRQIKTFKEITRMPGVVQQRNIPQGPAAWPFRQEMSRAISSGPRDIVGLAVRPLTRRVQRDIELIRGVLSRKTKYPPGWRGRPIPSSHKGIEL